MPSLKLLSGKHNPNHMEITDITLENESLFFCNLE